MMDPILERLYEVVERQEVDRHLTDLVRGAVRKKDLQELKDYFNVSDLVNPACAYHQRTFEGPELFNSDDTEKRLALGKKIEQEFGLWIRRLKGFESSQDRLDGVHAGVDRVVGRIDFLLSDSIIELKSKTRMPDDEGDVLRSFPQDVEQLAFYSVMRTARVSDNYLVFITQSEPYGIKAYKLVTKDFEKVKSILTERRDMLDRAVKTGDPGMLGRCRYFETGCKFGDNRKCGCELLNPVKTGIADAVEISYDPEFTRLLENERDRSENLGVYHVFHLISPRAQLDESHREPYVKDQDKKASEYLSWNAVNRLVKEKEYDLSPEEKEEISLLDSRLNLSKNRWVKVPSSSGEERMPYIVKVTKAVPDYKANAFHLRQLALTCAGFNADKGLIFVFYPDLDQVRVFKVSFRDSLGRAKKEIVSLLDEMDRASESGDFSSLPECPSFFGCCGG